MGYHPDCNSCGKKTEYYYVDKTDINICEECNIISY
mgnify:CR=1 FL=1